MSVPAIPDGEQASEKGHLQQVAKLVQELAAARRAGAEEKARFERELTAQRASSEKLMEEEKREAAAEILALQKDTRELRQQLVEAQKKAEDVARRTDVPIKQNAELAKRLEESSRKVEEAGKKMEEYQRRIDELEQANAELVANARRTISREELHTSDEHKADGLQAYKEDEGQVEHVGQAAGHTESNAVSIDRFRTRPPS